MMYKSISFALLLVFALCGCDEPTGQTPRGASTTDVQDSKNDSVLVAVESTNQFKDQFAIAYTVDFTKDSLVIVWKDDDGNAIKSFDLLKQYLSNKNLALKFGMNAGIYLDHPMNQPLGLLIQGGKELVPLNVEKGDQTNFYLHPNGVFYLTKDDSAYICASANYEGGSNVFFATQSGPMLLIDGEIHPAFTQGSDNLNIRNGVGVLPDGKVVLAMSVKPVNFFDFATYFKSIGCENALYLDGAISQVCWPDSGIEANQADFGAFIAVCERAINELD